MTLAATHRFALRQQAAQRADDLTDARDRLEADPRLQAWASEWWSELEPNYLHAHEVCMTVQAATLLPTQFDQFVLDYRRTAYLESVEFDTLVEDVADGEPVPS